MITNTLAFRGAKGDYGYQSIWIAIWLLASGTSLYAHEPRVLLHLPLTQDTHDHSSQPLASTSQQVTIVRDQFNPTAEIQLAGSARFNGRSSRITIDSAPQLGTTPFKFSMWVNADNVQDNLAGDLINQYDADSRTGYHLGIYTHGGVTNSQPNSRQLHFGIDQGRLETDFTDHGRLGQAVFVFAMCVHDGQLYAATCSAGKDEAGHVYRFEGGERWTDLGSPDKANAISAMAVYNGQLYVASSKYRLAGSSLAESENPNSGGNIFRLQTSGQATTWQPCGRLSAETEAVASLVVYQGRLYASSLYRPAGFFRYEGDQNWTALAVPDGKRVEAMTVTPDGLFATSYDEGSIFQFDGQQWKHVGTLPGATQTYGFAIYRGQLHVSEWPQAHVYRYTGESRWQDTGKFAGELEAMPLLVYNGKLYGGSLPSAQIFRYDRDDQWTLLGAVDKTPDVKYRRAWSMAVYQGRLFIGTLPSGRVLSIETGANATWDYEFPSGWHYVEAVRLADRLLLRVDGKQVAQSKLFKPSDFNLDSHAPVEIGFGAQKYFAGSLTDIQLTQP